MVKERKKKPEIFACGNLFLIKSLPDHYGVMMIFQYNMNVHMWQSILILFSHSRSLRCSSSSQWCGVRWGRQCLMEGWNHLDDDDEEEKPWKVICFSSSTRESSKVHTNFICFRVNFQIYSYSIVLQHSLLFTSTRNGRDGKNKNYAEMQAHTVFFRLDPESCTLIEIIWNFL